VQHALPDLLAVGTEIRAAIAARVRNNLAALQAAVAATAISLVPVEAGWSAILRLPSIQSDEAWALELLRSDGVLVQPGYFFELELPASVVVSLLPPPDTFADGIQRLRGRVAARL
jgi:alanine-synthesizing transaminase